MHAKRGWTPQRRAHGTRRVVLEESCPKGMKTRIPGPRAQPHRAAPALRPRLGLSPGAVERSRGVGAGTGECTAGDWAAPRDRGPPWGGGVGQPGRPSGRRWDALAAVARIRPMTFGAGCPELPGRRFYIVPSSLSVQGGEAAGMPAADFQEVGGAARIVLAVRVRFVARSPSGDGTCRTEGVAAAGGGGPALAVAPPHDRVGYRRGVAGDSPIGCSARGRDLGP